MFSLSLPIFICRRRTNVAKVSARRAVQKLVENLPTALGRLLADPLPRQRAILVAKIGRGLQLNSWDLKLKPQATSRGLSLSAQRLEPFKHSFRVAIICLVHRHELTTRGPCSPSPRPGLARRARRSAAWGPLPPPPRPPSAWGST